MRAYYISPEVESSGRKVLRALLLTPFAVALLVLIDRVILRRQVDPIDMVVFAVFFGAWTAWSEPEPGFDLEVDDTEIRVVRDGSVGRKISRDRTHYVREWSGNIFRGPMLVISEHGPIAMRFLGFVAVPKSLPEYEQIKSQALDWVKNTGR
jgi:hypothetical protein